MLKMLDFYKIIKKMLPALKSTNLMPILDTSNMKDNIAKILLFLFVLTISVPQVFLI